MMDLPLPSIDHPTGRPNFTVVNIDSLTLWYSYRTIVGFQWASLDPVTRVNEWGPTTGSHLNHIDGGNVEARKARLSSDAFRTALREALSKVLDDQPDE